MLILLEYTGLSWLVELYFLMLVSVRLLMNVWKFGRTLGQTFLSPPSDTGEEHLLMSGCPTYFADTAWHDSSPVVTCAKLWPDWVIRIVIRTKNNFHKLMYLYDTVLQHVLVCCRWEVSHLTRHYHSPPPHRAETRPNLQCLCDCHGTFR